MSTPSDGTEAPEELPSAGERQIRIDTASALPRTSLEVSDITGEQRLGLARQLLLFVGLYCIVSFGAYVAWPENEALRHIFEFTKIGVLPLVTLVVSFYFPKAQA